MKPTRLTLLLLPLVLAACGHVSLSPDGNKVVAAQAISMWATKLSTASKKFEAKFFLKNESKETLLVMAGDITCSRGNEPGVLHSTFNRGERSTSGSYGIGIVHHTWEVNDDRVIAFGIDQVKTTKLSCQELSGPKGDIRIIIHRVFDNPSNDRVTPGAVVATDVTWISKTD